MKSYFKYSILATLTLIAMIGAVFAFPAILGTTVQPVPFDSSPTAAVKSPAVTGWSVGATASAFDGDDLTSTILRVTATTVVPPATLIFSGFTTPALPAFNPGWVDLKIMYSVGAQAASDDTYAIDYRVGASAWTTLVPPTTWTMGAFTLAVRPWAQITDLNGPWDWNEVAAIQVRFTFNRGGAAWETGRALTLYEVWATVYPTPLPPGPPTSMSVQPALVSGVTSDPGATGTDNIFFVDVYGQSFTSLAGYEFTLKWNTAILNFTDGGFGYWPWVDVITTPNNTLGLVNVVATAEPPIVDTGISGNSPLARVYFMVLQNGNTPLDLTVSLMGAPGGVPIHHDIFNGLFSTGGVPEFPLGLGLVMVTVLAIPTAYIWRTRKQRRV